MILKKTKTKAARWEQIHPSTWWRNTSSPGHYPHPQFKNTPLLAVWRCRVRYRQVVALLLLLAMCATRLSPLTFNSLFQPEQSSSLEDFLQLPLSKYRDTAGRKKCRRFRYTGTRFSCTNDHQRHLNLSACPF